MRIKSFSAEKLGLYPISAKFASHRADINNKAGGARCVESFKETQMAISILQTQDCSRKIFIVW